MKKIYLFLFTAFLSLSLKAQWTDLNGPYWTTCNSLSSNDGTTIYSGTNAGVFKSTNSGVSWTEVNNGISPVNNINLISGVAVNTNNDIYVGQYWGQSGGNGVYKSTNGGASWHAVNNGISNLNIRCIAANGNKIIAGSDFGLFISNDTGSTWTSPPALSSNFISSIAFAGSANHIFVGCDGGQQNTYGLFESVDGGASWTDLSAFIPFSTIRCLSYSSPYLYVGTSAGVFYGGTIIFPSNTWITLNNGLSDPDVFSISATSHDMFVGTASGKVFQNSNGGVSWSNWSLSGSSVVSGRVYSMYYDASNLVVAGAGNGIYSSTNKGAAWAASNNGLFKQEIKSITSNSSTIFSGSNNTYLGLINRISLSGGEWSNPLFSQSYVQAIYSLAASTSTSTVFAGTNEYGVRISNDNGSSWNYFNTGLIDSNGNHSVYALTINGNELYAATDLGVHWSHYNAGSWGSWVPVNNGAMTWSTQARCFAIAGTDIYAGTTSGIFRSTNNGGTWSSVSNGLGLSSVISMTVSGSTIYAGTDGGGVYLSTNAGASWTAVNNGALTNTATVKSMVASGNNIFAATDQGLFLSYNNGALWTAINTSQISNSPEIICMTINGTSLIAGTQSKGVWRAQVSDLFCSLAANNPVMISTSSASICTGGTVSIPLLCNINPATFNWVAQFNGAVLGQSNGTVNSALLTNTLSLQQANASTVIYNVTPSANGCTGNTQYVAVTVNPLPILNTLNSGTICSGGTAAISINSDIPSSYQWKTTNNTNTTGESTTLVTSSLINNQIVNNTNQQQTLIYTVTPTSTVGSCVGSSANVNLYVNPTPVIPTQNTSICSGDVFTINPVNNAPTVIIPSTISYTWTYSIVGGISGGSPVVTGQPFISQTLSNSTTSTLTGVYQVTPVSGSCTGQSFSANVNVNPTPQISAQTVNACSGSAFSFTPVGAVIPSGTTYTWTSPVLNGLSGGSAQTIGQSTINQTLTNPFNTPQTAVYVVTPHSGAAGNCAGASFTLSVTVSPTPVITNSNTAICSGSAVNLTITSNPSASYSWFATATSSVSGESTSPVSSSTISDVLSSGSSTNAQSVIYSITPTLGTCTGADQNITVTVNPKPVMSSVNSKNICSGSSVNLTLTSLVASSFSWAATDNPTTSGESYSNPPYTSTTIGDVISHSLTTATNVIYNITPTANIGSCAGATQTVTITVNPAPTISSPATATLCSGSPLYLPLTSVVLSDYSWQAIDNANTLGESTTPQVSDTIKDNITSIVPTVQHVYYTVTPTSQNNGCQGNPQTINVTVKPLADAGFSYSSSTFCKSGTNPTPSVNTSGGTFSQPAGLSISPTTGTINLAASSTGQYTLVYSVSGGATTCSNKDSIIVTITNSFNSAFSYTGTPFCQGYSNPLPTFTGNGSAGAFSSSGSLQFVNINTGEIDLASSPAGTYTITNFIAAANGCAAASATFPVVINASPIMTSVSSSNVCSESTLAITLGSTVNNSTYSWIAANNANTSGENLVATTSSLLKDTLSNLSGVPELVYYTVTPTAAIGSCVGASQTLIVTVNPLPVVSFSGIIDSVCLNSAAQILAGNPSGANGIFSGATMSGNVYTPFLAGQGTHTITYTYTDANQCRNSSSQAATVLSIPLTPDICIVTVDSTSQFNVIVWEKPQGPTSIESYYVYRDTSNNDYALIGIVPFDSLSIFEDTLRHLYQGDGDPNAASWNYKIAAKDTCGNYSLYSNYHQTIHFQDLSNGNFNWNHYGIQGQPIGAPVSQLLNYKFYRDNLSNGNWQLINSLAASATSYYDANYASYPNGRWKVEALWNNSCDPTARIQTGISKSRSNIKNRTACSIDTSVTAIGNILTANLAGAAYQWLDCNNNYAPISGATNQSYSPTNVGAYAVKISSTCVDTSRCIVISGLKNYIDAISSQIKLIPNPAKDIINISVGRNFKFTSIQIFDNLGREVYSSKNNLESTNQPFTNSNIDISHFAPAVYTVLTKGENFVVNKKLVISR